MKRRQGFTLVELMVAMALIIFIMSILSGAFVAATTTFRNLKAAGDLANKLRATTQLLQRDLAQDHFEGKKRLSDPHFWNTNGIGVAASLVVNGPPQQGFFQIWQGTPAGSIAEGADLATVGSYRSVNHALAFTIKTRGNQMGDFPTAGGNGGALLANLANNPFGPNEARYLPPVGATTYNYQWAEVAWFLVRQPDTTVTDRTNAAAGPLPLYTLYRRQRLAVPGNSLVPAAVQTSNLADLPLEVSCTGVPGNWHFNSPIDLTVPARRFGNGNPATFTPLPATAGSLYGSDIQLTDVLSFDVRVLVSGVGGGVDPFVTLFTAPLTTTYYNGNTTVSNAVAGPMVFDTWSSVQDNLTGSPGYSQWNVAGQATSIPMWNAATQSGPIIKALQISIRIWDQKTNQTRQVTMIQAM